MKQVTKIISFFGAAFLVLILSCSFYWAIPQWLNNLTLQNFASNLYDYPLPPDTVVINKFQKLQKVGNGNNCFYIASVSLVSSLSRREIEKYYEDVSLPVVDKTRIDGVKEIPVRLEFEDDLSGVEKIHFRLELTDIGSDSTFDIRCH